MQRILRLLSPVPRFAPNRITRTRIMESGAHRDDAIDQLLPLVYDELRVLARRRRQNWDGDFTLDTTALVHEAWLKLRRSSGAAVDDRQHFLALAARTMRQVLSNYARDRRRLKRGGGAIHLPDEVFDSLTAVLPAADSQIDIMVELDEALERLTTTEPRQARVVECRFFTGLGIEETAAALNLSTATVKRDWALARAWLYRELHADDPITDSVAAISALRNGRAG